MIGATISVIRLPSHRKRLFLLCFLVCFPLFFGGLYAQTSGTAARDAFIEQAKKYLGTPYRYGGTNGAGIDCSGLIYTAARESLSLNLPRTVAAMHTYADAVSDANRQPGDLVFFSVGGKVTHGGIFLGGRSFIHSASDGPYTGVIISTLDESYWKRTYIGSGRILPSGKQVADGKQVASGSQDAGGDGSNNQPKEASSSGKKNPSPGAKTSSPIQIIKPWDPP
ncbi:MAG: C40 family peptidase, partial [Spirochaetaceae bacterium]|nr:C40 family peptidase [Spirochaetaceae bacterium]